MIRGKMIVVGTMGVDGEDLTGCFIECTKDDLRQNRSMIFRDVEIRDVGDLLPCPHYSKNGCCEPVKRRCGGEPCLMPLKTDGPEHMNKK